MTQIKSRQHRTKCYVTDDERWPHLVVGPPWKNEDLNVLVPSVLLTKRKNAEEELQKAEYAIRRYLFDSGQSQEDPDE